MVNCSNEEALYPTGFEDCIIGEASGCGHNTILILDRAKCITLLIQRDGMTEEDATEYFEFNVEGAYMGENSPLFLSPLPEE